MAEAVRDQNHVPTALFESSSTPGLTISGKINQSTGRVLVDSSGSTGITGVAVATANGLAGTSNGDPTTPTLTLSTTITGILKGNGTAISAATDGSDYLSSTTGVTLAQGTAQTIGTTSNRVLKLWATDITVTNAITGSITGNAATATALATGRTISISGDLAYTSPSFDGTGNVTAAGTLATVNSNVGTFGSATATSVVTVNGKGLVTAASNTTITPAVGSITGLGTGVATALAINVGSSGAFVTFGGALGTPASGVATNITGLPAASVLAGTLGTGAFVMDTKLTVPQVIQTVQAITVSSNAGTADVAHGNQKFTNSSAATMAITLATSSAVDGQLKIIRIYDFSGVAQTIGWTNTENSTVSVPTTSNGSTTLPLTVGFQFNGSTSLWRCIASA